MISRPEAQAKFMENRETLGSHDEVFTDGSKMNERVGAAAVINPHFQNGETTCRTLTKRLLDNSTIFAAEATAITLALNYYQHMGPVHHDVIVYSDSVSCLQAIEVEDTENPFICHIMNLLCRPAYPHDFGVQYTGFRLILRPSPLVSLLYDICKILTIMYDIVFVWQYLIIAHQNIRLVGAQWKGNGTSP